MKLWSKIESEYVHCFWQLGAFGEYSEEGSKEGSEEWLQGIKE